MKPRTDGSNDDVQFVPSRVEGLDGVTRVSIFPDRIELVVAGQIVTHRFFDIAQWPKPKLLWKLMCRIGIKPRWLPVADRDWFHEPANMFFRFYTQPRLTVYMPCDESKDDYGASYFRRIQDVLGEGGFDTRDLG